MISRRRFLLAVAATLGTPLATEAQQMGRVARIGYLAPSVPKEQEPYLQAFRQGLQTLGYIEGQNILIERRFADGRLETLPTLAGELVHLKVDLIVAVATPAARAAKGATTAIPIVFVFPSDPVGSGLVASLSRPGGNVTGITDVGLDLTGKRLDLLKQLVPRLKRLAALGHPADPVWEPVWREAQAAARDLRIDIVPVLIATPDQFETAFVELNQRVQALFVAPLTLFFVHMRRVIELASRAGLPALYEFRAFPDAGGLMSYGPSYLALMRNAARYVDKILKGARPGDLPVEQPTVYELVINLKTAKVLGIVIPSALLLRADQVIE